MGVLDIKVYPDSILRKKANKVHKIGKEIRQLAFDMIETMRFAKGIGLAGPQVGISKRIIVIEAMEDMESPLILVNPKILKRKGRSSFCEGCLSVPEATSEIVRPESVVVEACDLSGKTAKIDTGGLLARVIQHEIDHLDGVLFIDRISFLKRRRVLKQISPKVCIEL